MTSAEDSSAPPRQSVFISYASEDRAAGRLLRDALAVNGLEVWFDENELGGGDDWDQKIRQQIRDCDYFMPVISATTERRKEGYFRREWRLAVERTMDMADDVLFLLPVVIDDTPQAGARVPGKFLSVQWLRVPGGLMTDQLAALSRRMLAGDHRAPPLLGRTTAPFRGNSAPPGNIPASTSQSPLPPPLSPTPDETPHHLPMPPFPPHPEKGGFGPNVKYVAEVCWWIINAVWSLLRRLPKWARALILVWLIIALLSRLSRHDSSPTPSRPPQNRSENRGDRPSTPQSAEIRRALRKAAEEAGKGYKIDPNAPFDPSKYVKAGEKFAQVFANSVDEASDKELAIVPFPRGSGDGPEAKALETIFNAFFGKVMLERSETVGLVKQPYSGSTDSELVERGDALDSKYILQARLDTSTEAHALDVRLLRVKGSVLAWSGHYPLAGVDSSAVADQIADGVLGALPKK
jgi:hypothetical protein